MAYSPQWVMPFGKHKGDPLHAIETSYIEWAFREYADKNPFWTDLRRKNVLDHFSRELERRNRKNPIDFEVSPDLPLDDLDMVVEDSEPSRTKVPNFVLSLQSVEAITKNTNIVMSFLRRLDQKQGLRSWLLNWTKEAYLYGQKGYDRDDPGTLRYLALGRQTLYLRRITPLNEDNYLVEGADWDDGIAGKGEGGRHIAFGVAGQEDND